MKLNEIVNDSAYNMLLARYKDLLKEMKNLQKDVKALEDFIEDGSIAIAEPAAGDHLQDMKEVIDAAVKKHSKSL